MENRKHEQLLSKLKELKFEHKRFKKSKKLVDNTLKSIDDELLSVKMHLRFMDISKLLLKDNYKLISLTKNDSKLFEIEYQIIKDDIVDTSKTYKMLYNNYYYYGCRTERQKIKNNENKIYDQLVRLHTIDNVKKQVKLDGLMLIRPLFIDFSVKIDDMTIYIEVDENSRHFNDGIQIERDKIKDIYIIEHDLKLLRIDPVDMNLTDVLLQEYINTLIKFDDNILKVGKRYINE